MLSPNRSSPHYSEAPSLGNERVARLVGHIIRNGRLVGTSCQILRRVEHGRYVVGSCHLSGYRHVGFPTVLAEGVLLEEEGLFADALNLFRESRRNEVRLAHRPVSLRVGRYDRRRLRIWRWIVVGYGAYALLV